MTILYSPFRSMGKLVNHLRRSDLYSYAMIKKFGMYFSMTRQLCHSEFLGTWVITTEEAVIVDILVFAQLSRNLGDILNGHFYIITYRACHPALQNSLMLNLSSNAVMWGVENVLL